MKKHTASLTVMALAATTLSLATVSPAEAGNRHHTTDYALGGRSFGSLAKAQSLATGSGPTAPAYLGCTRLTGVRRHNSVASTGGEAESALEVTGVDNHMRTYRNKHRVGNRGSSQTDEAVLGNPGGPTMTFRNLHSTANTFARRGNGKLGAAGSARAGSIVSDTGTPLDGAINGASNQFNALLDQISDAGGALVVPGFGELHRGERFTRARGHRAVARISALRATMYGDNGLPGGNDDVRVVLARSRAVIHDEVRSGIFRGRAVPLESVVAGDLLSVGRVNDHPLPCPGTRGKIRRSANADTDLGDSGTIDSRDLSTAVFGVQKHNRSARAWTKSRVNNVDLNGGDVSIKGIVGRVNVKTNRHGKVVRNNIRGSHVGELVIDGDAQEPPSPGDVVDVPGLGTLEFFIRNRKHRGSSVTALRITLAPGTPGESVIDLGQAKTFIQHH